MGNKIIEALLAEKIESFKSAFSQLSNKLFYDDNTGKLIHPGEYGMFRESVCKDFFRSVVPKNLDIDQGFIVNNLEMISSQCDILIYDSRSTPLIENSDRQRFYPVETICAVGEIKSKLDKSQFKKAINKLSNVKKLKSHLKTPFILKSDHTTFNPSKNHQDQIFTFLICQKLDFDYSNIFNEFETLYENVPQVDRHNMILSLEDGLMLYSNNGASEPYSFYNGFNLKNRFIEPNSDNIHIKVFASNLFMASASGTILFPQLADYLNGDIKSVVIKNEK